MGKCNYMSHTVNMPQCDIILDTFETITHFLMLKIRIETALQKKTIYADHSIHLVVIVF